MLQDSNQRSRAIEVLIQLYWMPVYKYLRMKWKKSEEDAQDLTQGFFLRSLEKNFLADYNPEKARFRTYLRTCLDGFASNELKSQNTLKRGGETIQVHLDFQIAENELKQLQNPETPERIFEKEWVRSLFRLSLETFSRECAANGKETQYKLFERYDMDSDEKISYKDLAQEFKLPVTQVTNYLADARKQFRRIVLDTLRASTSSEEEFRSEVRSLLGIDIE
jgi:RNA polymerase sigma factor (sigma-70 family)